LNANKSSFVSVVKQDSKDFFYTNNIRETQVIPNTATAGIRTTWMRKTPRGFEDIHIPERPFAMRLSLKKEEPLTSDQVPCSEAPYMVRAKERISFMDARITTSLTTVWEGANVDELKAVEPIYEVECEYRSSELRRSTLAEDIVGDVLIRMLEMQGLHEPLSVAFVSKN
jgi:hypothetical protein